MTKKAPPKIVRLLSFIIATLALVFGQPADAGADVTKADVVVYGATPGGVCAAIGAAREGVSVILLEPTDHVGGLNTGGLSHSDSNQCDRRTVMGLFDEWHTRIEQDYESRGIKLPYQASVKDHAVWTYEPHVAARATKQLLREAKVQVLTRRYLQTVRKNGTRITDLVTSGGTFNAEVFIDATYEGDLMAASGVSWTIGREGRAEYGESYAGKQYPKAKMNINGFDSQGKLLPLVTTTDAGHEEAGDKNVMVYSFRLCLTEDPENRVPFPEPANYDPARFEIMRRYAKAGGRLGFDLYRLPNNKFDGNNSIGGQFSLGLVGGGNGWCEADEAGRTAIWEAHKQYTLELYHFLTNDPAVPKEVRNRYARLGLCKDEFADYGHFSPALYIREGRRMRGMYVLSQKDILVEPEKDDPIVISSFPIDSHDCQRVALRDGGVINEGTIFPVRRQNPKQGYAYHVPYRSILPPREECSNLLVPVALSCTHVGISSIRVEPTWMMLGQSAGIAAALTARHEQQLSVQKLSYPQLRERLLAQGQVLDLPRENVADLPDHLPDPHGQAADDVYGQDSQALTVQEAESRLRGIYEEREFRPKPFRGEWLPDSSGYTVGESIDETAEQVLVRYDLASGERTVVDTSSEEKDDESGKRSPDGQYVLYSENGNLQVRGLYDNRTISLTKDADGISVWNRRASWSPDGKRIAFVQSDYSRVRSRAMVVPSDPSYPEVKETHFARVGETIPTLRVGVVDVHGRETRWVSIPEPAEGFYLGQVDWAGNSDELLVEKLSRFRDEREFLLANVRTAEITRIYHESDPAWVVASIGKNAGLEWIGEGREFIVISEKDGWRHAYVYARDGKQRACLTPGPIDIIERVKVDEAGGWFYYNASPDNATQKYLYRVRLDGTGKPERVTPMNQPGTHDYAFSPDAKWAFHTYSTFDTPPVIELVQFPAHRVVRVLADNKELRKKVESVNTRPTEFFQLDIGGGVVMDAWMMKPADFDPAKKYPVLVYVYGEPHAQTVLDAWGKVHADYHRVVADLGYLVVSIDNRGTPAPKGAAWRRSIFGKLGVLSTEEQAAGLPELGRQRAYVDLSRVGIWGWSGGGSNTLNAMFRKPDVYHVGIAVAAKPQPHLYNAWFQEIYMQTPEVNPEGYREAAPINFAEGLQGDLLIIHGTGETNTHLEIIEGLVDRLVELGKPFDYMTYPNRDHGIREGAGTSVHMRMHMLRYLLTHLPPGPR